jgi:eukaryotic-like serine/threonine-protein kinase
VVAPRTTKRVNTLAPERWARIEELFHRAAECDVQQRTALLDEACRNDAELRREVEELLSSDRTPGNDFHSAVRSELGVFDFPLIDETVSHYRILEGLGGGGMGLVYRAEDIKLGRQVAIKFLPEESANDPVSLGRFEREARSASALDHPNICPIHEFGEHEGRTFLVMQLLEGQTLRELIAASEKQKAPFELSTLIDLAIQILDGLDAAHRKGIVHRDIKPANIFVTKQGQAKILDFGLAKLTQNFAHDNEAGAVRNLPGPLGPANLFLSRTGVAMGTAGYMSPEQVRGEELDSRTDLFSFGLVLYEMATGKRAFAGETGPLLQNAILNQTPPPAREANAAIPAKLERIINRSLEKNVQARYQAATEIRADLESLKSATIKGRRAKWWALAAGASAMFITTAVFWMIRREPQAPPVVPEISMRQLTANSDDNPAVGGMISPNGRYLAYSDSKGLHIKVMDTGETRDVPIPEEVKGQKSGWACGAWFPDSTWFLANVVSTEKDMPEQTDEDASIWAVSVAGGVPRRLRNGGIAWSFSPDGRLIAFAGNKGRLGPREIWLMDSNGEHARKLFESGDERMIGQLSWTSDGQRVTYLQSIHADELTTISRDLSGGAPVVLQPPPVKDADIGLELGDGRMVFTAKTPGAPNSACNFWVMRHDLRTGKIVEQPRRLTNWTGFCMLPTSVTADRKKLVFTELFAHSTIYMADLQRGGMRLSNLRRFASIDSGDWPCGWTSDGKALIFRSNRDGVPGIYEQSVDGSPLKLLAAAEKLESQQARVSPDGKWLMYSPRSDNPSASRQLVSVPTDAGPAQRVFSLPYREYAHPSCARLPSNICVIFQLTDDPKEGKELVVTSFDPIKGPGPELARIARTSGQEGWAEELSPDGTRIALAGTRSIRILSVRGKLIREIKVPGSGTLMDPIWGQDGDSLFVSSGGTLLRVGLDGQIQTLINNHAPNTSLALPSPDGRHLAIMAEGSERNLWMMENF